VMMVWCLICTHSFMCTNKQTNKHTHTQDGGRGGGRYSRETLESVAAFDEEEIPHELIEGGPVSQSVWMGRKGKGRGGGGVRGLVSLYVVSNTPNTELILRIDEEEGQGAVLVFLPGWEDISRLHESLSNMRQVGQRRLEGRLGGREGACRSIPVSSFGSLAKHTKQASRWRLYPLHSQLPMEQQREIFQPPPTGLRKVGRGRRG
jgi:hypothetical protein